MKKIILYIGLMLFSNTTFSQIGLYTENVQSGLLLQIDAGKDNPLTGTLTSVQALNDITVSNSGYLGIGTLNPTAKLHIVTGGTPASPNPQLKIENATAQAGKILMAQADGTASWQVYVPGFEIGTMSANGMSTTTTGVGNTSFQNTYATIDLLPGKWFVYFNIGMLCNGNTGTSHYRVWAQATIGDASTMDGTLTTGTITPDRFTNIQYSNNVIQGMRGFVNGWAGINNTTTGSKRYYLLLGHIQHANTALTLTRVMSGDDGFSNFFAFRVRE